MARSDAWQGPDMPSEKSPSDLFRRYARGRLTHFWKRQILTAVGSIYLVLMISPLTGLLSVLIALIGEAIDCLNLRAQIKALDHGLALDRAGASAGVSAAVQALSVSLCVLMTWFLTASGEGMHFALIFLMAAALNAGLVWPYHPLSALSRLAVYGLTLFGASIAHSLVWRGNTDTLISDMIATILMCYLVVIVLQFMVSSFRRQSQFTRQILETAKALEMSDSQRRASQGEARRLALVARHANDSIILSSPDGRITWVNEAFTRITGYSKEDAQGKTPGELLNDSQTDMRVSDRISDHVSRGEPIRIEVLNKRKDGARIWVETNIVPIRDEFGEVELIVAIERDITAIKAHEKELAEAKILAERGEEAKAEFLATMSHEIRTPMNGIMGLSDLLVEFDLPEEAKSYAVTIKESAGALLSIINDILDFSKLNAGQLNIDPAEFDLRACFSGVMELLGPQASSKGIFLDLVEDKALPRRVIGDDGRFRQILLNVVGNAIKFTESGGVTIKPSIVAMADCHELTVKVRDTGIGIPPDRLAQVFEKFQQADSKTTRKFGGTGLGLAISRALARRMSGDITASSQSGEGSEFVIIVKFGKLRRANDHVRSATEKPNVIAPMSVLIAEDNKTNRFLLEKYLKGLPLHVSFAHDGKEAVDHTVRRRPDLIFTDMSMPEMDGLEATRRIRELPDQCPHIIALTANAFSSDRDACFEAGMDDFLAKPVRKNDLLGKLAEFSATIPANPL